MKKSLLTLLGAGLLLTSCQSDEPFAPVEGGEKQVTFTLNVPGELGTRAGATNNASDKGGLSNNSGVLYYTLVLDAEGDHRTFTETGAGSVTFSPTVVLGRNYTVTAYAQFGNAWGGETPIEITKHFNDETKDAYHFMQENIIFDLNETNKQITLKRPFGKLRLLATDYNVTDNAKPITDVKSVTVEYTSEIPNQFDAVDGIFDNYATVASYTYNWTVDGSNYVNYYKMTDGAMPLFADYIPANDGDNPTSFTVTVTYGNDETYSRTFNDIPVKRNALTTLKGNFFTAGAEITVTVDDNFDVKMKDVADGVYIDQNGNYYVSNANGLKWVSEQVNTMEFYVNQSTNIFDGKTVYIVNDIDLGGAEWRPIGDYAFSRTSFNGTFDGQGHTISNFKVTEPVRWTEKVTEASYGFFGNVKGTVKNLTVKNATVNPDGGRYSAALVGRLHNGGCVENCHVVTSSVTINHWQVGGLVGQNNNGNIRECSVTGSTITGKAAVGAIIGMDMTAGEHTIENCRVANTALVQNASFGASYDESYGIAVGLVNASDIILNLKDVVAENNTIKGVASNKLIGDKEDGAQVREYINGSQVVLTAEELVAAITSGGSYILANDIALNAPIQVSDKTFYLNGNGYKISQSANYPQEGTTTTALIHPIRCTATIENVVFDGLQVDGPIRTVDTKLTINNVTVINCTRNVTDSTAQGLFRLHGESTVTNCVFKDNTCPMAISLNWDGNNNLPQVVENCVFENNTCISTAVLYYVKGSGCVVNNNKFIGNNVTVNGGNNAATVYMGFTENNVITNNLFQNNTVNAGTSKRVAGGLMIGYDAVITRNAFINNTVNATNAKGNNVCASVYYTDIDLSGNYWGGNAPVENDDYFIEYADRHNVIINDYLTENPIN